MKDDVESNGSQSNRRQMKVMESMAEVKASKEEQVFKQVRKQRHTEIDKKRLSDQYREVVKNQHFMAESFNYMADKQAQLRSQNFDKSSIFKKRQKKREIQQSVTSKGEMQSAQPTSSLEDPYEGKAPTNSSQKTFIKAAEFNLAKKSMTNSSSQPPSKVLETAREADEYREESSFGDDKEELSNRSHRIHVDDSNLIDSMTQQFLENENSRKERQRQSIEESEMYLSEGAEEAKQQEFLDGFEFDFSNFRAAKRLNYVSKRGVSRDEYDIAPMDDYLREEGVTPKKIQSRMKKQYTLDIDDKTLLDDFKEDQAIDEFEEGARVSLLGFQHKNHQRLSSSEQKQLMRKQLEKRNITVKKVHRKSGVFIADSFLKFHLAQNVMFYLVLFTVPSVSVIDCIEGHSILSYFAIAAFMLFVFVVDVVNLRYHINKELLKLELKNYHGKHKMRRKLFDQLFIYCTALCELFLT